jgi:ABC-2 type transport system permease protein
MRIKIIKAVAKKEVFQIIRDKRSLIFAFLLPLMLMILYSYGIRFDVNNIRIAVSDQDWSSYSRKLIESFISSGYFERVGGNITSAEAERMIINGEATAALIIPVDFSRNLKRMKNTALQVLLDGMDSNTANISQGYIKAILLQYNLRQTKAMLGNLLAMRGISIPPVSLDLRIFYNPELKSNHFIIPGIIVIIMMLMGAMLTTLSIVREREFGSFEIIISTPIRSMEFIIGKVTPYVVLSFLDLVLIIVVGYHVFNVPIKGSIPLLLVSSVIYLIATLGLGILISTIARTQQIALLAAMLATMLPSILLSGFIFPIENMPLILKWISALVPAKYFMAILRAIYLKGTGLTTFWLDLLIMTLYSILLLVISAVKFKKRLD